MKRIALWALIAFILAMAAWTIQGRAGLFCTCGCHQMYCRSGLGCMTPQSPKLPARAQVHPCGK
jgi:hypothetical protein